MDLPELNHYGLPPIITAEEAAEFLRVNVKTVYAAIQQGQLPGRRVGKRLVIFRDALLQWLQSTECKLPQKAKR